MKFLHLADLHLGYPLRGGEDGLSITKTLEFVVEKAKEYSVEVVVIAGDVFHRRDPDGLTQHLFAKFIRSLASSNIKTLVITGNHEGSPNRERSVHLDVYKELPLDFIFISKKPEVYTISNVNFITLPYPFKENLFSKEDYRDKNEDEVLAILNQKLLETIDNLLTKVDHSFKNVLVAHLPVSEGVVGFEQYINFAKELPLSIEELDRANISYFALGHLHKSQVLRSKKFNHYFVYPGSIDRIDFGEETDLKGFYLVDIEDSVELQFIENPYARRFYTINIENDTSFGSVDFEKVKTSITRIVIKSEIEDEAKLKRFIDEVKKISYVFTGVNDERMPLKVIRSAMYEFKNPMNALIEYIEKSEDDKIKRLKDKIIEEAKDILEHLDEA